MAPHSEKSGNFETVRAPVENGEEPLQEQVDTFVTTCRSLGLKITHQRLEIYRELATSDEHPSAEALFRRLRKRIPSLSLDTVYRTLTTLEQHGLIARTPVWDVRNRFDANMALHHHLVCTQCGRVEDFYWPSFDRSQPPKEASGWGELTRKQVEIRGVCKECLRG